MAIVRANYVKRGRGAKSGAKAHVRYIAHRRDSEGNRVTRTLFGFDGPMTREQAYRLIDEAQRGSIFYRLKLSPDPKKEDCLRDLELTDLTIHTMLALEKRLGRRIAFAATMHDDHSAYRHLHALVITHRKLTRADFAALRRVATARARYQRRERDRVTQRVYGKALARNNLQVFTYAARYKPRRRFASRTVYHGSTCPLCGYYQLLPYSSQGHRCPADGLYLRRDQGFGYAKTQQQEVWRARSL
jgi:hypothetical protein